MTVPMFPGGGIRVEPGELRAHAGNVEQIAGELDRAADAAQTVSMNHDAFGLLIGFVGGWFRDKEADLAETFRAATDRLHGDAVKLRSTADDYARADRTAATTITSSGTGLELPL